MKLTNEQRAAIHAGIPVKFTFDGRHPCPIPVGYVKVLSKHVKLEVTEIRRTAPTPENPQGDHSLGYTVHRKGGRYLAKQQGQSHPEQYATSPAGSIDTEAGEAVDELTQRRFTREARAKEARDSLDVIAAAEEVLRVLKERADENPTFKREGKLTLHRMRRELDRLIERQKRKAA